MGSKVLIASAGATSSLISDTTDSGLTTACLGEDATVDGDEASRSLTHCYLINFSQRSTQSGRYINVKQVKTGIAL